MNKKTTETDKIEKDTLNAPPEPNEPRQGARAGTRAGARGDVKTDAYAEKIRPFLDEIAADVANGATEGQLYAKYGVGKTAFSGYKKKYPELARVLEKAKSRDKIRLSNRAHDIALGYDYTETTTVEYFAIKDGERVKTGEKITTVTKHSKADAGIMQFLLINRFPTDFARDPQVLEIRRELLELKKQIADGSGGGKTEEV